MALIKYWSGRIIIAIAILIAIISSTLTIYSSNFINTNLNTLSVHPFAVSNAINRLKIGVASEQIRLGRLTTYNTKHDVKIVRDALTNLKNENKENIKYIIQYYLGPPSEAKRLNELLNELYEEEDKFLAGATERTLQDNSKYIDTHIKPIYTEIDDLTRTITNFIENTVKRLSTSSNATLEFSIIFSITISILLILLAVMYQRAISKRIKVQEAFYRDFLFKTIAENVDSVFMVYNLEKHKMEFVSSNSERILGINSQDLESGDKDIFAYCRKEDCADLERAFKSEILQIRTDVECMVKNPMTGIERSMHIMVSPTQEHALTNRYILALTDQTDIKKNQQILRDALMSAQSANKSKSEFLSRVSHEIRTPMNAIIGMCTIAGMSKDDPLRVESCLTKIMTASKHLLLLINDILDMSKIESGKFVISNKPFLLDELINNVSLIIYNQANAKNQHFDVIARVTHEALVGDSLRLNQILINLLSNAVKYTPENGTIKLEITELPSSSEARTRLRFTISDNGIGMSSEFMEKLFLPFEQEGQIDGGTGLGLAITKNLVTMINGTINVESEPGKGSVFSVELPFMISKEGLLPVATKEISELKTLIVDDDKDTCEHVSLILNRLGVENKWVLSGIDGVEHVITAYREEASYDVVFMDWKMPDLDGIEATKKIRQEVGPDTLIIIISAVNWAEIEDEARKAGANGFITKPMFQSTIYNTLLHATRKSKDVTSSAATLESSFAHLADFSGKCFLLVEDNVVNLEIAETLLGMTNAQVETAVNGKIAMETFMNSEPGYFDAILMDVQMPIMDGYAATRAIRESSHPQAEDIPIIAMTANAFSEDVSAALQAGMNAHVAKPIDITLLFKIISQLCNK